MDKDCSKLFNRQGYVPLKEYIDDINRMKKCGPWKLPLRWIDHIQFYFLMLVEKFSWFSNILYIVHTSSISPSYKVLLSYVKSKSFFDYYSEGKIYIRGFFSYYLEKKIVIRGCEWSVSGQGVDEDRATAFSKALGEMIERAVSGMYDMNKDIKIISYNEIIKNFVVVYPPKYHRFLDIQRKKFKELNYNPSKSIEWVGGKNLITKEKTYIPRSMTSWLNQTGGMRYVLVDSTTNGSAGYFTKEGAVLRGLLEVVQRDAFLVHWLTMTPPDIVIQKTLPDEIQEKINEFEISGLSLYILNVTSLSIPSIVIIAINEKAEIPQVVITGASAVTFETAVNDALREMVAASGIFYYANNDVSQALNDIDYEPFISGFGRLEAGRGIRQLYWRGGNKVKSFEWFLSGKKVSYCEMCKQDLIYEENDSYKLKTCLEVLGKFGEGYYPIVYYPKNNIQDKLGYYIAQVFIPKSFPFYLVECYGTFDSDRLVEFALSKNIKNWKLNPSPHMFS